MFRTISTNGILDVTEGIIAQQVNCCNVIGAGVSSALINRYPIIKEAYHDYCSKHSKDELFGTIDLVQVATKPVLYIANIFSQRDYGNSAKTGIVYTDMDVLTDCLKRLIKDSSYNVYVPDHIGCGLAGGDWNEFLMIMLNTGIHIRERSSI